MDKKKIIIGSLVAIIIIYLLGVFLFTQKILPNTKLSDHEVAMIDKSSLEKVVKEKFGDQTIAINDTVVTDYAPKVSELGATINAEELVVEIEAGQNPLLWPINLFTSQNYDLTKYIEVDEGTLNGKLVTDKIVGTDGRTKSASAKTYFDDKTGRYAIKKEVNGTVVNDKFKPDLVTALSNGDSEFDATKYYSKPKVVTADLEKDVETLNKTLDRTLTVQFGNQSAEIPSADVETFIFLDDDGKIDVDNTVLYNYLTNLSTNYISASSDSGQRVVTSYGIDNAYYQIESAILSDDTGPITVAADTQTIKQLPGQKSMPTSPTYIEVSISQQHMWVYNNNELIASTPVVTGNESKGRATPRGTFSVWNKETDKVLDGATVGYDYKVPVDYWMAIDYTGVGIHDIEYLTSANAEEKSADNSINGSHGCINTPDDLMENIYNNTPLGTPVYVIE